MTGNRTGLRSPFSHNAGERRPYPKKRFGQHFLSDLNILNGIADAADLSPDDVVVEVGPGRGALTSVLAERVQRVVAVEIDRDLTAILRERFALQPVVRVLEADVLAVSPSQLLASGAAERPYVVVANLPYNVAAAVLRHFLEGDAPPRMMVVMVQLEVAEAIVAPPGKMSMMSVATQVYGDTRMVMRVPPGAFVPPPAVQSAVVRIDVSAAPRVDVPLDVFFRVVRAGFGNPRKQLRNSLSFGLHVKQSVVDKVLRAAGIDVTLRAQVLSLDEWTSLTRAWIEAART